MNSIRIFFCLFFLLVSNCNAGTTMSASEDRTVSLSFRNDSFADVVAQVSKMIHLSIKYDASWQDIIVSGKFEEVPVEEFFYRILKGKNIIIESQDDNQEIVVKFFGDKSSEFVVANYSNLNDATGNLLESYDPVTGKTMAELNAIYELQKTNREKRLQDPNAIDPMTGKTMSEVNEVLKQQEINRQVRQNDPEAIDVMTGRTVGEIKQVLEEQKKSLINRQNDPNDIDPVTGKTRVELNSILEVQARNKTARLNDPDAIDPMTGKTMAEINAILNKQEENRIRRLGK